MLSNCFQLFISTTFWYVIQLLELDVTIVESKEYEFCV
jgi:hypothetical protein